MHALLLQPRELLLHLLGIVVATVLQSLHLLLPPLGQALKLSALLRSNVELLAHCRVVEGIKAVELIIELVIALPCLGIGERRIDALAELLVKLRLELLHLLHPLLLVQIIAQVASALVIAIPSLLVGTVQLIELLVIQVELLAGTLVNKPRCLAWAIEVIPLLLRLPELVLSSGIDAILWLAWGDLVCDRLVYAGLPSGSSTCGSRRSVPAPAVPGVVPTPTPPAVAAPSVPPAVPDAPAPPEAPAPPDCPSAVRPRPAMKIALTITVKKHFI